MILQQGGVFRLYYSQITHQKYAFKENNKYILQDVNSWVSYAHSMWYVINELKNLFIHLKNEPFLDENNRPLYDSNNKPVTVYDKTMIVVTSDHGMSNNCDYLDLYNSFVKKGIINSKQVDEISKSETAYNNMLMIKPFKYDKNHTMIHNQNSFTFNNDQIIFISDIPIIIENYLKEYNLSKDPNSVFIPSDQQLINQYSQIIHNVLTNPLDPQFNSIKLKKQINRELLISSVSEWRFFPQRKEFNLVNPGKYQLKNDKNPLAFDNYKFN